MMFFCIAEFSVAQEGEVLLTIQNNKMVLKLSRSLNKAQADSVFDMYALPKISIDSLFNFKELGKLKNEGWKIEKISNNQAVLSKPLEDMSNDVDWSTNPVLIEDVFSSFFKDGVKQIAGFPADVLWGMNNFKKKVSVQPIQNDEVVFLLTENEKAKKVFLSGNFNNWSHQDLPMTKTDSGWVCKLKLTPGKYYYKFIVDGKWTEDKNNGLREDDGHNGYNSVFYKNNYSFKLAGYSDVRRVILTGSFNNWNEKEINMQKSTDGGWFVDIYLREGLHTYKFIVDGKWITDPTNKRVRPDGEGNFNSEIGTGDTITFNLKGYVNANQIILSGSFNNWRTSELVMEKTPNGWKLNYMLPQGNYEYKFIVDGNWITDPENQFTSATLEGLNSFFTVKPNYTFHFKGDSSVKNVFLSGTFNEWSKGGYSMQKDEKGEWTFPIYLKPGKYLYKLIVDGNWILDPSNKLWEENEYRNGNSVLWIENKVNQ
jgi:1,4-alpha-glucan branching enzyme